jgi:hypothetical protein
VIYHGRNPRDLVAVGLTEIACWDNVTRMWLSRIHRRGELRYASKWFKDNSMGSAWPTACIVGIQLQVTRIDTQKTGVGQNVEKITLKIRLANANSCDV